MKEHAADRKGPENGVVDWVFASTIGIKLENNDISALYLSAIPELRNLLLFRRKCILPSFSLLLNHLVQLHKMV